MSAELDFSGTVSSGPLTSLHPPGGPWALPLGFAEIRLTTHIERGSVQGEAGHVGGRVEADADQMAEKPGEDPAVGFGKGRL